MFIKSIRVKNTLLFMAVFFLILSIVGYLLFVNLENKSYYDIDRFLYASAIGVSKSIDQLWEKEKLTENFNEVSNLKVQEKIDKYFYDVIKNWVLTTNQDDIPFLNIRVVIYDDKGNVISSSRRRTVIQIISNKCIMQVLNKKPYYENITIKFSNTTSPQTMRVLTIPIVENNDISYMVRVAISVNTINFALTDLKLILFILLPFTILLTGIFGIYFTNLTLKPVNNIIHTIHQITVSNLKLRVNIPDTKDEISMLAETFNSMLDRLDKTFTSQKQFLEDISHEIKTPLAILKGQQEVALKKVRSSDDYKNLLISNLEEINRIIRLSENLLLISQFESRILNLNFEEMDLIELIMNIKNDLIFFLDKKNITFNINKNHRIIISADKMQIKSLFLNLIDNAIKYNIKDGKISVTIKKENKFAKIIIRDTGIGIDKEELPFIFDRYYRANKHQRKKGYGLGLSIVKSIVDMHHGHIKVKSKLNEGTAFIIYLAYNN